MSYVTAADMMYLPSAYSLLASLFLFPAKFRQIATITDFGSVKEFSCKDEGGLSFPLSAATPLSYITGPQTAF